MQARAQVLRVEGGQVWLKVADVGGGCGRCDEPGGCRSLQLTQAFGAPRGEFVLPLSVPVQVGDRVLISIPDGAPLSAALASYGLATVLLVLGAAIGNGFAGSGEGDLFAVVGAGAGLAVAWMLNRLLARSRNWRYRLRMELAPAAGCVHALQESR
ncbi:SoxR reducing system RseC family protein [Thauera sp.]|uniref:SoxR reducing system RseC family protein n=1 Tax=Thauera sp. TaxID=1905334 RepID=UPI002D022398|nr:SoxR reducing system RseC family protein [Thauera sp.]HRP23347.1 SoxR reducing system RseC family protein [Thauera sp.]